jgi:hypothetical protein
VTVTNTLLIHQKYAFVLFFTGFTLPPNHILPQIAIWLPVRFGNSTDGEKVRRHNTILEIAPGWPDLSFSTASTARNWPDRSTSSSGVPGWTRSTDADRSPDQHLRAGGRLNRRSVLSLSCSPSRQRNLRWPRRPPRRSSRSCSLAARRWPFTLAILHFRSWPAPTPLPQLLKASPTWYVR